MSRRTDEWMEGKEGRKDIFRTVQSHFYNYLLGTWLTGGKGEEKGSVIE